MTKISVILPTNRVNNKTDLKSLRKIRNIVKKRDIVFNNEFTSLSLDYLKDIGHILEPTVRSLSVQQFRDFEVIITHRYPYDVQELVDEYWEYGNDHIKLVEEKPCIWHELGKQYPTANNNRNCGILNANKNTELLLFIDDFTIFNKDTLTNIWNNYKKGYYCTLRGYRRIRYDKNMRIGDSKPNRGKLYEKGMYSSLNFINNEINDVISNSSTWTYGTSVSMKECLKINGFESNYDGNFGGTDQDFGRRLEAISKYKRKLCGNIYEFANSQGTPRQKTRDDEMFRIICHQTLDRPKHIVANQWKPTSKEQHRYLKYHINKYGCIDENWRAFLKTPMYD